jgi:flavin-binding protein dodecin
MLGIVSIAAATLTGVGNSPCRLRPREPLPEPRLRRPQMGDHVYSVTEIVGASKTSVEDAIQHGIKTASKTLRNLEWFEVTQIKGHIVDGGVGHYQVCMKLGLRYDQK